MQDDWSTEGPIRHVRRRIRQPFRPNVLPWTREPLRSAPAALTPAFRYCFVTLRWQLGGALGVRPVLRHYDTGVARKLHSLEKYVGAPKPKSAGASEL